MSQAVNVLSIDAWADGGDGWIWNNWYKVGTCDLASLPESDEDLIRWFVDQGYASVKALTECYIDDDQYNLVLTVTETHEPLYAIAYGESEGGES